MASPGNKHLYRPTPFTVCLFKAKFHYKDQTGPARTQRSFAAKKSVRVRAGPCRVRVVEFSFKKANGKRSRPIQMSQCLFPELAISNARI